MINIALVGCDTSHSVRFADILNDAANPYHVPHGRVIAVVPGGFGTIKDSQKKAADNASKIAADHKVTIFNSISELPKECDAIFIEGIDGAQHLSQVREAAEFGVPIFIDKPLALSPSEASEIFEIGRGKGIPMMSSSALRFDDAFQAALLKCGEEKILGADIFGPMSFVEGCPGFFWYGIHTGEMLFSAMGSGIVDVEVVHGKVFDQVVGVWEDGRIGSIRGTRTPHYSFGGTLHTAAGPVNFQVSDGGVPYYARLLENILEFVKTGVSSIPEQETLEIIQLLHTAETKRLAIAEQKIR